MIRIFSQNPSKVRHVISYIAGWVAMALFAILGTIGGVAMFFGAAFFLSNIIVLFVVAFIVGFLIVFAGARMIAKKMKHAKVGKIAFGVGVAGLLLLTLFFSLTLWEPWPGTSIAQQSPPVPAGVNYWNLNTGSHIAYLEVPAQPVTKSTPIIFVGGGPGEEDVADTSQTQFFGQLAQLGYNVYFYDQIGSGLSARLSNPAQYTLARQVADLEAIRQQIGAQRVILMGSSWGGTLVANYMAAHPQNVAKAIFTSPAPINYYEWTNFGSVTSRLNKTAQQQANQMLTDSPRFLAWYVLGEINPQVAHNLVSDQEADSLFNTFLQLVQPGTACNASNLPNQPQQGNGFYDNIFTTRNAQKIHPAENPRTLLSTDYTPSLILTGSCNYISWASTWQYKATLPNSTLLYLQDAGHVIYIDQPQSYLASIEAFLLGTPLPIKPWVSSHPPSSFQGPA